MALEFDHAAILTFTPRNLFTVTVMVIVGFFILHMLMGGTAWLSSYLSDFSVSGDYEVDATGLSTDSAINF